MKKNIDIDEATLFKLKIIAAFEEMSVKTLMQEAVKYFVEVKERERLEELSKEQKEDLGLLALMQQSDRDELASRDEIMKVLDE